MTKIVLEGPELILVEKIKRAREKDKEVVKAVKKKVYVLKDKELRLEVIQLHHNMLVARHKGRQKITELVTKNYQWPEVTKNVGKYVKECNLCQRIKNRTEAPAGKLMVNKVSKKP